MKKIKKNCSKRVKYSDKQGGPPFGYCSRRITRLINLDPPLNKGVWEFRRTRGKYVEGKIGKFCQFMLFIGAGVEY